VRFLADECIWRFIVEALHDAGLEGEWIHDISPGLSDREILALSFSQRFLIVTEDSDFGELIYRDRLDAYAVVRVRLSQFEGDKQSIAIEVASRIARLGDSLVGQITTIEPKRTRHRAFPSA
jgi:predicted nuclease of predicted toxin-antitoxin system